MIRISARLPERSVRYVMVDEYQDTNYIQERLLDRLSEGTGNLCVVGDEDQSLYRWRGATVRNILEFPTTHPGAKVIKLTTNYRSHEAIVNAYDRFMSQRRLVKHLGRLVLPLRQDDRAETDATTFP
jgi:superfamily I DNA/RNA helicase